MEIDVKSRRNQRNRRRERAQRMQAERDRDVDGGEPDSAEEDTTSHAREKPPRAPRRKKSSSHQNQIVKSAILEEDIIDGFAILAFKNYEDLEYSIKLGKLNNEPCLSRISELTMVLEDKSPKLIDTGQRDKDRDKDNRDREREWNYQKVRGNTNYINNKTNHVQTNLVNHNSHNSILITQDPGTSDDSGRASERLTTSSVAPRDADSSRDRLSDASSRCSSGKGYICDGEGEDDKGSDGGSVVFPSTPSQVATTTPSPAAPRKSDFPTTGLPLSNGPLGLGGSASPVPVPPGLGPAPPAPSPAPAALPPPNLPPPYPTPMQVSNGPLNTNITPITTNSSQPPPPQQSNLIKPSATIAKVPSTTNNSTNKQQPPSPAEVTSPSAPVPTKPPAMPAAPVALSNGFTSPAHLGNKIGSPSSTPINSIPPPLGNGVDLTSPSTGVIPMPIGQPPSATTPTALAPSTHPALDSGTVSGRTNSPAVATSAVLSAAAPIMNGNGGATTMAANGNLPIYRTSYPGYPLYAPYNNLHHSPYLPPAVPSPSASPRIIDSRTNRESPLMPPQKQMRSLTPSGIGHTSIASTNGTSSSTTSTNGGKESSPMSINNANLMQSRTHSPRGHSPNGERDSYSSNVSSLSRSSATTPGASLPPYGTPISSTAQSGPLPIPIPYNSLGPSSSPIPQSTSGIGMTSSSLTYPKSSIASGWPSSVPQPPTSTNQLSPASVGLPRPSAPPQGALSLPPVHSTATSSQSAFPPPLFATPLPPPPVPTTTTSAPHPFSAESLFQTSKSDQADLLRRELDSRFLDRSGLSSVPPTYLRPELHHHQHQHTHLHQHQPIIPTPAATPSAPLFPPPLFKDIPKMGAIDSSFYRTGLGLPSYPGYSPSLIHPGIGGPTPFVPPTHLPSFAPKQPPSTAVDPTKPKQVKTGRWNAMHVRIAWEIYHHQAKQNPDKAPPAGMGAKTDLLRPPSHSIFSGTSALPRHPDLTSSAFPASGLPGRPTFDPSPIPTSFLGTPSSHLGSAITPFSRYSSPFSSSPFSSLSPFTRDLPIGTPLSIHDHWRRAYPPPPQQTNWSLKPDPSIEAARREAEEREQRERERREQERQRREREERERQREKEKEEKLRKEQQEREQRERERREKERREMERREMERERMIQQQQAAQRLSDNSKYQNSTNSSIRERSPLRNGTDVDPSRIKEEPRKSEQEEMMMRAAVSVADPRYHTNPAVVAAAMHHPYMPRHPHMLGAPTHLQRTMLPPTMAGSALSHFPPPGPGWSTLDPYQFRIDPMLRTYAMEAAIRAEEERVKAMSMYAAHHLRSKEPSPVPSSLHRMPPGPMKPSQPPMNLGGGGGLQMPVDIHKKEDTTPAR